MASATLNSLVATSKTGGPAGSGLAPTLPALSGTSAPGAAVSGGAGLSPMSTAAGAVGAPATIGDFLAMLSGMLQLPEAASADASAAPAGLPGKPNGLKTEPAPGTPDDVSQIYGQLLALMQDSSGGSSGQPPREDAGAVARAASSSAATQNRSSNELPVETDQLDVTPTVAAQIVPTAHMVAPASQGDLLAKLVGAASSQANLNEGDQGQERDSGSPAALLQADLKSLFADPGVSSHVEGNTTLKDLSALLATWGDASASGPAARAPQPLDPTLLQGVGPTTAAPVANNPVAPPASTAAAGHLAAPVGTTAWTEQLGTHLAWMAGNDQQSASLKLTPPHLGPLEVQITVGDDNKASVYFSAPHADTRAALGEALPRLRELFGASGLTLMDANVSREPSRQKPRAQSEDHAIAKASGVDPEGAAGTSGSRIAAIHVGILDTYA